MSYGEILLVEDDPKSREATIGLMRDVGFGVITADTREGALKIYRQRAATITAAVFDLRLHPEDPTDISGGLAAEDIHAIDPDLPLVALTAFNIPSRFPFFDRYFVKGAPRAEGSFADSLSQIEDLARTYQRERSARYAKPLVALKEKYQITDEDFQRLVSLLPIQIVMEQALLALHGLKEGMRMESWQAGETNRSLRVLDPRDLKCQELGLRLPVPIVIDASESCMIAELYASPMIYAYGDTEEEAVYNLATSLHEYHLELSGDSDAKQTGDLVEFQQYLREIFGDAQNS